MNNLRRWFEKLSPKGLNKEKKWEYTSEGEVKDLIRIVIFVVFADKVGWGWCSRVCSAKECVCKKGANVHNAKRKRTVNIKKHNRRSVRGSSQNPGEGLRVDASK